MNEGVLDPVPENYPDPDCPRCHGEGVPQSLTHQFIADEWSNTACPQCWKPENVE